MQALDLVTSVKALLTKTVNGTGAPGDPNYSPTRSYTCDLEGNEVPVDKALPIYRDRFTAKTFAKVPADTKNATHFVDQHGDATGFYVEAPDYNKREGVSA